MIPVDFPHNWHWLADDGRIFSSAKASVIEASDQTYLDWQEKGYETTQWPRDDSGEQTDGALQDVLSAFGLHASLGALKASLITNVDAIAERERLKYITAGAGQAMEYQQSAAEAKACLAAIPADPDHEPGAAEYPMLAASLSIDGATITEVAMTVNAMHEAWLSVGSAIRAVRLGAKLAIDAAETVEAAQAAFDAVVWSSI